MGNSIVYCPELASQSEDALQKALIEHSPAAALVTGQNQEALKTVQLIQPCYGNASSEVDLPGVVVDQVQGEPGDFSFDIEALRLAERHLASLAVAERLAACGISSKTSSSSLSGSLVTLVGAGIVNLVTAFELVNQGATVKFIDDAPDPRSRPNWQRLGATHGGENARMYCFTEADSYNEKNNLVYAQMNVVFRRRISEGGWLAFPPAELDRSERAWIRNFDALPRWLAEIFTQDIHHFNIASGPRWEELRRSFPHLFEGVNYTPDILRIYSEPEQAEAAQILHRRIGSLRRVLDIQELSRRHPAFRDAAANGKIAGALEIRGFTLSIHDFAAKLLAHLKERGVHFCWNRRVTAIERTSDGCVNGLRVQDGVVRSEHYVLSPGAYGKNLLKGTRSTGKIQGILGLWLHLPNLEPRLRLSVKIHREGHTGEDSNVTLATDSAGRPTLILGSGYGFIGSRSLDMNSNEIASLYEAVEENARRFLPRPYSQAVRDGTLQSERKACVRPFTSTGLGIFEVERTCEGGRLVITCGHNTGGFTQAPAVAEAVAAALGGASHPMQALYDPERGICS